MKNEDSKTEQPCTIQNVRQSALQWWNSMTFENQFYATIKWLSSQNRDTTERHPHNLTGREIQEIHELHSA
jgi:hypothetical protein